MEGLEQESSDLGQLWGPVCFGGSFSFHQSVLELLLQALGLPRMKRLGRLLLIVSFLKLRGDRKTILHCMTPLSDSTFYSELLILFMNHRCQLLPP